uniref:Uncharacterized protein n=1 Tax=Glossina austeni TaxID=7395 RepID=A0A1A9VP39_GLOAU
MGLWSGSENKEGNSLKTLVYLLSMENNLGKAELEVAELVSTCKLVTIILKGSLDEYTAGMEDYIYDDIDTASAILYLLKIHQSHLTSTQLQTTAEVYLSKIHDSFFTVYFKNLNLKGLKHLKTISNGKGKLLFNNPQNANNFLKANDINTQNLKALNGTELDWNWYYSEDSNKIPSVIDVQLEDDIQSIV